MPAISVLLLCMHTSTPLRAGRSISPPLQHGRRSCKRRLPTEAAGSSNAAEGSDDSSRQQQPTTTANEKLTCVKMVRPSRLRAQRPFLYLRLRRLLRVMIRNLLRQRRTDRAVAISKNVRGNACAIVGTRALRGRLYEHTSKFAERQCTRSSRHLRHIRKLSRAAQATAPRLSRPVLRRPWAVRVHLHGGPTMPLGFALCCRLV